MTRHSLSRHSRHGGWLKSWRISTREVKLYSYPLWQQMVHVVNHSSYHRGQVTTLLRQLGTEAMSTDFLVYYDEKPKQISLAP